jgi:hypothetical protein
VAGIGGVTHDADGLSESRFTTRVGGALRAAVGALTARLEVVDVIVPDHVATRRTEHDVHVRVGIGVPW